MLHENENVRQTMGSPDELENWNYSYSIHNQRATFH